MAADGDEEGDTGAQLGELRDRIAAVDRSLLELIHRRMDLAAEVGRVKARAGRDVFVAEAHDRVLNRARLHADACGVSEEVMEAIFAAVTRGSVERQHRIGLALRGEGGNRLLILGGAGNMGGWFGSFSRLLGHAVDLVDPAMAALPASEGRFGSLAAVPDLDVYDAVLVSVPLGRVPAVLEELTARRPRGLVIEIASIKAHLEEAIAEARAAGLVVASLHPMFGPGKSAYEPLTFVLACHDDPGEEQARIAAWLRHPYTHLVPVPFPHHDRLMGWLLGLAHLSGMLFGCALTRSGLGADELWACASTTFDRQAATALSVLGEDHDLYYDIQRLNPHRGEVYRAATEALAALAAAVEGDDRAAFRAALGEAGRFLGRDG